MCSDFTPQMTLVIGTKLFSLIPHSKSHKRTLNLLVTEGSYWALFYMPLYKCVHNLLNVLAQIGNKIGLK
jgi:hypothetical protein